MKTAAAMIGLRVAGLIIAFGAPLLYARVSSPHELGLYFLAASYLALLAVPAEFGMGEYVMREASKRGATSVYHWVNWGLRKMLPGAGTVALLTLVAVATFTTPVMAPLAVGAVLLVFNPASRVLQAGFRAEERPLFAQVHQLVTGPVAMLAFVMVFWLTGATASSVDLMASAVMAGGVCLLAYALASRKRASTVPHVAESPDASLVQALPFALLAGIGILNSRVDLLIVAAFVPAADLATYGLATRIAEVLSMPLLAATLVLAPRISGAASSGALRQIGPELTSFARVATLATVPLAAVCLAFPNQLINVAFGSEYEAGARALQILVAGHLFNVIAGPTGMLLVMSGHTRHTLAALGSSAAICGALTLVLSPRFGIEGAAMAAAIAMVWWNVVLWRQVRRTLGIAPSAIGF